MALIFYKYSIFENTIMNYVEYFFQAARSIVIAEFQNVIYKEWLPAIFGPQTLDQYKWHFCYHLQQKKVMILRAKIVIFKESINYQYT